MTDRDDLPEEKITEVNDPEEQRARRAAFQATRVGPEWASLLISRKTGEALFVLGVTKAVAPLLDRAREEHYFSAGWVLDKNDEPTLIYEIEYTHPIYMTVSLHFTVKNLGALIGVTELGRFGISDEPNGDAALRSDRVLILDDVNTEFSENATQAMIQIRAEKDAETAP